MIFSRVLIANRGEIAVRVAGALSEMGLKSLAVYSEDDVGALHTGLADRAVALAGSGPAAYLDLAQLLAIASREDCDAVHPGYGFLSERADAARAFASAGIRWIGAGPDTLQLFGDKRAALKLAVSLGIPTPGLAVEPTVEGLTRALAQGEAGSQLMLKARAGGGGRGMRQIRSESDLTALLKVCGDEAEASFGDRSLYVERYIQNARHIEIQVIGDGQSWIVAGDRDCSLQRSRQKIVEIAPAPGLGRGLRASMHEQALALAHAAAVEGLCTFEFLVPSVGEACFIEANPRVQVEHTVTEQVTGLDLVQTQIRIAAGASLADLGLTRMEHPTSSSVQIRINAEQIGRDGVVRPAVGRIDRLVFPGGPGIRIDSGVTQGAVIGPRFDSLLAKIIVTATTGSWPEVRQKALRALHTLRIDGVSTNAGMLSALLERPEVSEARWTVDLVDAIMPELTSGPPFADQPVDGPEPLDGHAVRSPITGVISGIPVVEGQSVHIGQTLAFVEALKMVHAIEAPVSGQITRIRSGPGDAVAEGAIVFELHEAGDIAVPVGVAEDADPDRLTGSLVALRERLAWLDDLARPDSVARRRKTGQRTARENLAALVDPDSFIEYGGLAVAAQRQRRSVDDLIRATPADGLISGVATVNRDLFEPERAAAAVLLYDYTVLAGTQGYFGHKKLDRMLHEVARLKIPLVLFAEGGGGRPGDIDAPGVGMLDTRSFASFAKLSGKAPLVGVVSGRCFAGNAVLLGCCDVIIATPGSNIGMSGPAMIEGAGLGTVRPEDIGPFAVQTANGVVDLPVADEIEAARVARQYLSYFQGTVRDWTCDNQRQLRHIVPEDSRLSFQVRRVLETVCDTGTVLELKPGFGRSVVTALARIEGRPVGILANDCRHLAGALDADAGDKAARFMRLCDAFGLPLVSFVDTPGFVVGPDYEAKAQLRHVCRMLVAGANLCIPNVAVFIRRGFGLGSQAMVAGSYHSPMLTLAWPNAVFGAMGLEGAVRLGFKRELEALVDPKEREARFQALLAGAKDAGSALNMASALEIDAVIDPAETRDMLVKALATLKETARPEAAGIDPW